MHEEAVADKPLHRLECMEIWGGNEAIDDAIAVSGLDAWVISQPHAGDPSGGDIHFVSTCGSGRIARFMIADVAGHGKSASEVADKLRRLMRKHINRLNQTRFVRDLNREFLWAYQSETFATALLTSYFASTDHLIICNAGHPVPLWYRSQLGTWYRLEHTMADRVKRIFNLPLGIIEPTSYYQFAVRLERNDLVLIYSDAVIEARNGEGRPLGDDGLLEVVGRIDPARPERFCPELLDALSTYRNHGPAEDDVTVALLHHNAGNPPRQSIREMVRVMGKMFGLVKV